MKKTMNLAEMSYNDLVAGYNDLIAKSYEYLKAIHTKSEEVKETVSAYKAAMANLGFSEDEMKSILDSAESIKPVIPQEVKDLNEEVPLPEVKEDSVVEPIALPEHQEENKVETKTTSVFDLPVFKEPYNPLETKKSETPIESEETLPTMESLLSDDPEYKAFYHPVTPKKKDNRRLSTIDELLSDEPINRILCLGNEKPKGKAYRQHTRINHVGGIIPTETATGKTGIYIPPTPPMAA